MSWIRRLVNHARRRRVEREIDEEIRFHIAARVEDNLAAGMTAEEARRDALRRFGSPAAALEATRDADVGTVLDGLAQDLRFGLRSLRRRPGFTVLAVLILALGTGASTAVFTVLRGVLLRPLPFAEPERLVSVSYAAPDSGFWLRRGLEDRDYLTLASGGGPFAAVATFASVPLTLTGAGDAVRVDATEATPDFFRVLGVAPALGRGFADAGATGDDEPLCVISDGLWRTRFAADPGMPGRRILLDGVAHTVAGVMPAGFDYPAGADVWRRFEVRATPNLVFSRPVIARLPDGLTIVQAAAAFDAFIRTRSNTDEAPPRIAGVMPLAQAVVGDTRRPLLLLGAAVALVLLIAVANAANLLLMRAASRGDEIVTRLALGASRGRLARLLLVEGGVIACAGAAAGVALAAAGVGPLLALLPAGALPRAAEIRLDGGVLLFATAVAVATTLAVSLASIAHAARTSLVAVAQSASRTSTATAYHLRHGLVVLELALALILLAAAGVLGRGFLALRTVDPGFSTTHLLTLTIDVPERGYESAASIVQLHERLLAELRPLPSVQSAAAVNWLPLDRMLMQGDVYGENASVSGAGLVATKAAVSPDYFQTLGIRLRGREFTAADSATAPAVVVVSETVARRLWPDGSALGKRLTFSDTPAAADWFTIVGVAGDVRHDGPGGAVNPAVYRPIAQSAHRSALSHMTFALRTAGEPASIAAGARAALGRVDAELAPQKLTSMDARLAETVAEPRFQAQLLAGFALIAVLLSALGVYGVLAASVVERRREMGIRIALGASAGSVVRLMLRRTALLAALGTAAGAAGAALAAPALSRQVGIAVGVDIGMFAAAAGLLFAVSVTAGLLPARRASRADPLDIFRAS